MLLNIWALLRENRSSGFLARQVSNQSPQLQRLARNLKAFPVANSYMILSKKRIRKALIRLRGWAGWSVPVLFATKPPKTGFLTSRPICKPLVINQLYTWHYIITLCDVMSGGGWVWAIVRFYNKSSCSFFCIMVLIGNITLWCFDLF